MGDDLMSETWLKPNRRAILIGAVLPAASAVLGMWLAFAPIGTQSRFSQWTGLLLLVVGSIVLLMLIRHLRRPRVSYGDGHVHFYLKSGLPIVVPVEVVEAFFLGQGSAKLPVGLCRQDETVNLVARLSQRHTQWAHQEVKPALGNWCEGYVTIRGTWCEPLNSELIRRLNRRLKEVKTEADKKVTS
jgi:hypothetical protein